MSKLTESQKIAYQAFIQGDSIFLSGKAGTGKSFVIHKKKEFCEKNGLSYMVVAPTGIAASNAGGATIHRAFRVKVGGVVGTYGNEIAELKDAKLDVVIIDECSMLRCDVFDQMWLNLKRTGINPELVQWVFVGDIGQLPPVVIDNELPIMRRKYTAIDGRFDFRCSPHFQQLGVKEIKLDKIMRQSNMDFIDALDELRTTGKIPTYFDQFKSNVPRGVILSSTNKEVDKFNQIELEKMPGDYISRMAIYTGEAKSTDCIAPAVLSLKDGCKVMYLKNDGGVFNGSLGTFHLRKVKVVLYDDDNKEIEQDEPQYEEVMYFVSDDKKHERVITFHKWVINKYISNRKTGILELKEVGAVFQWPVTLAYAITIHKSQGLTLEQVTVPLGYFFVKELPYVALSRCKTPEGLTLLDNKKIY